MSELKKYISTEDIKKLLADMVNDQIISLKSGSIEEFMKWFKLNNYDDYYVRRWFNGYAVRLAQPEDCKFKFTKIECETNNIIYLQVIIKLNYKSFDDETITFDYKVNYDIKKSILQIVDYSIKVKNGKWADAPQPTSESLSKLPINYFSLNMEFLKNKYAYFNDEEWWEDKEITEICKHSKEYLKANFYCRAIPKSVRFRNTHPEIDCAGLLSDIMTMTTARLAFYIGNEDLVSTAQKINLISKKNFIPRTNNEKDLKISVRELSLLPLYNIDELLAFKKNDDVIQASCAEMTSFYATLLRHAGMSSKNVFVVAQPFHYLTMFKLDRGYYIEHVNEIMPMSKTRLYEDTEVTRIFSPIYYLDESGQTNMPIEVENYVKKYFRESVPIFSIPKVTNRTNVLPIDLESKISIKNCANPIELHKRIKKYVYMMSMKYPDSTFTWAKYSYQTLFVCQPEVYLIWSLKSQYSQRFSKKFTCLNQIFEWIKTELEMKSIFEENERIMTADQVIRHKKGNIKDRALFIATISTLCSCSIYSGIVITSESSYAVLYDEIEKLRIYDSENLKLVSKIKGNIVVAFDDKNSYSIFQSSKDEAPRWLKKIYK
ncbi:MULTISPECIES: hypothetical protein [Clostridium]|uniref:hypothetical protein n=1 Tax=Clostridium TaxID=1485 RepID=UPI0008268739|nr:MULTISPECIES: hypothetical protein [Clostridium]PJI06512.1 hypothetical protein CUB90_00910 [Clostridium sp. CT7]